MTNTQTALAGLFDGLTQTAQADLQTQTIETLFAEWVVEFDKIAATDAELTDKTERLVQLEAAIVGKEAQTARDAYLQIAVVDARGDMAFSAPAKALAALAWQVAG